MSTLLHIDTSARMTRSISRELSSAFVEAWARRRPNDTVLRRDLGAAPPPFIDEHWIAAVFADPGQLTGAQRQSLAPSDAYLAELEAADVLVVGMPMYNYGVPAVFKAWIDQIIRVNRTFDFDLARGDFPLRPLLADKDVVLLSARGEFGFEPGGIREEWNHLDPYIRTIAPFLGAERVHHVGVEYQEFEDQRFEASRAGAFAELPALVGRILDMRCLADAGRSDELESAR